MSAVLLLVTLSLAFVVLLKISDMLRDLSFEQRQTRAAVEHLIERFDEFHRTSSARAQHEPRDKEFSRNAAPLLDEILEA